MIVPGQPLPRAFYQRDPVAVARDILGMELLYATPEGETGGYIVETEAYHGHRDAASHAYRGRTDRNAVMFGPCGHAYVYFTYGMHHCFNIVTGVQDEPAAVLVRAVHPSRGVELMRRRRGPLSRERGERALRDLVNGPGKLCQAFGLTREHNGSDLTGMPLTIQAPREGGPCSGNPDAAEIVITTRIGIARDVQLPWRFYIKDDPFVSVRHRDAEKDLESFVGQTRQDQAQGESA